MKESNSGMYLGDGAYVELEGDVVVIYTSNGIERTNIVYLEPSAVQYLMEWLSRRIGRAS